jgi:chromosome segregation ATPase
METQKSTAITSQIKEAETQLAQIDPRLANIARERTKILRSDTFNDAALVKLEEEEKTLKRKAEHLRQRIDQLTADREEAEAAEAQERLNALPKAAESLKTESEEATADFNAALSVVSEKVKGLAEIHYRHKSLIYEAQFLVERYEGVHRSSLPQLPDPPNFQEIANNLLQVFLSTTGEGQLTPSQQKLREWTNKGRQRPALRQVA